MLHKYGPVAVVTDSSGDAVVQIGSRITGRIVWIKYLPGTLATAATLVFAGANTGVPVLTKASAGTSNVFFYPQAGANKVADGAAITDSQMDVCLFQEPLKLTVSGGGNVASGSVEILTDE